MNDDETAPVTDVVGTVPGSLPDHAAVAQGDRLSAGLNEDRSRRPEVVVALASAALVLAVAIIGYKAVIPVKHVVRSRLAMLVITRPGVAEFDHKAVASGEQPASRSSLAVLEHDAKISPQRTGFYSIDWQDPRTKDLAGILAFALPNQSDARVVTAQLLAHQFSPSSYAADQLKRTVVGSVAGVPGSHLAVYRSTKPTATSPTLVASLERRGAVVVVVETVLRSSAAEADGVKITRTEDAHLQTVAPNFSLTVTSRPSLASAIWIGGSGLLFIAALTAPPLIGRSRRRHQRRRQEELDRLIVVRGQTVARKRRASGS